MEQTTAIPFSEYIRILGRGKNGSRSLTREEARLAMSDILSNNYHDLQLGAFLMLLRVKEETPEELAGFVDASRATIQPTLEMPAIDIDWGSYAGKKRHLPWFILSALLLSHHKVARIFMHGTSGHMPQRIYTQPTLAAFGLPVCENWQMVKDALDSSYFAYLPLGIMQPKLEELVQLRPILGLRSPVHSFCRMLNPLNARLSLQSIFHPGYLELHQQGSAILEMENVTIIKGDGGEAEVTPDRKTKIVAIEDGQLLEFDWDATMAQRQVKDSDLDINRLAAIWRDTTSFDYGKQAVISTAALLLKQLNKVESASAGLAMANELWDSRDRQLI
mgnify:CR=1 FL=1|tara:strand:- start:1665 stop:2663 length:999 start_codon:yes stop_codon:yes gene_type:complete